MWVGLLASFLMHSQVRGIAAKLSGRLEGEEKRWLGPRHGQGTSRRADMIRLKRVASVVDDSANLCTQVTRQWSAWRDALELVPPSWNGLVGAG